jgi:hypothetical protein
MSRRINRGGLGQFSPAREVNREMAASTHSEDE